MPLSSQQRHCVAEAMQPISDTGAAATTAEAPAAGAEKPVAGSAAFPGEGSKEAEAEDEA